MTHPWLAAVCGVIGHRERRLRKGEPLLLISADMALTFPREQTRICDRCGRLRAVKTRKAKV